MIGGKDSMDNYSLTYEQSNLIMDDSKCMGHPVDALAVAEILKNVNDCLVLELGAASGGWPIYMESLGVSNCKWVLVENFSYSKGHSKDMGQDEFYYSPKNKQDLISYMNALSPNTQVEDVIGMDIRKAIDTNEFVKYHGKVDVLRIDCLITEAQLDYFVNNLLNETSVVIIDDCRMNYSGIKKLLLSLKMMNKYNFNPVAFGYKENVYCKDNNITDKLKDTIHAANWQCLRTNRVTFEIDDHNYEVVSIMRKY